MSLAALELGVDEQVVKRDLGELLLKLEELHEAKLRAPKEPATRRELTDDEQRAALELLRDPKLLERIALDIERCGVVGERTNALVGYLAATSRKLDRPLAVVIQSSSAAGKSSLMDAVLELMPEEERTQYSAMTGQSLFYLGESDLRHRILAIVEEEGAERAAYALKLLQSEGELTIASTGKDPADRASGDAGVSGGRPGDDLPHDDGDGGGRGAAQSVPGPERRRRARADARHPCAAADGGDAGRDVGQACARTGGEAAPGRAADAATARRGEPLRRGARLFGPRDAGRGATT